RSAACEPAAALAAAWPRVASTSWTRSDPSELPDRQRAAPGEQSGRRAPDILGIVVPWSAQHTRLFTRQLRQIRTVNGYARDKVAAQGYVTHADSVAVSQCL